MNASTPEFSVEIALDDLPKGGRHFVLEADEGERAAVANRLGVLAVESFTGDLRVTATKVRFAVRGKVFARLKRECVVSLEEITEEVDEAFEIDFVRQAAMLEAADEEISLDSPEVHSESKFDIGELLVQQLSLAMDPFPKKQGAAGLTAQFATEEEASPFAQALAQAAKREENQ